MTYQISEEMGLTRVTVPSRKNWVVAGLFNGRWWAILLSGLFVLAIASVFAIILAIFGLAWWADHMLVADRSESSVTGLLVIGLLLWGLFLVFRDLAWAISGEEIWELDDTYLKMARYVSLGRQRLQIAWPKQYALHNIRELSIGSGTGILGRIQLTYQPGRWGRLVRMGKDLDFGEAHALMETLSHRHSRFAELYRNSGGAVRA